MSSTIILRAFALLLVAFSVSAVRLAAQDASSVAEAARRARQQKQESTKPAKVIDNDSLPPSPLGTPVASTPATPAATPADKGPAAPAAAPAGGTSGAAAAATPESNTASDDEKKEQLEALKQQIAEMKGKIDLSQREIALAQDTYLSNPDHEHDTAGKEKLDTLRSDLEQAQSQLADLLAKLSDLGVSPSSSSGPNSKPAEPAETPKP